MPKERETDLLIHNLLAASDIAHHAEGSGIKEVDNALRTASKLGTGRPGFPEYVAQVGDYILVLENKASAEHQAKYLNEASGTLLMDTPSVTQYAENGALHYALRIVENSSFKRVFAFGCSGTERGRLTIRPIFVSPSGYRVMKRVQDFRQFAPESIDRYYREVVCGGESLEQVELIEILRRARGLHEDLRNYGQLGDDEKPLIVSGILLALMEPDFSTERLTGDATRSDGAKLFDALSAHLDRVHLEPPSKKQRVVDQFRIILNRPELSNHNPQLGKSPLRYFAEYLYSNILTAICNNAPEDILGRFYGEFIRYSGGDGQTLGVVLTPRHITDLFCDLAQLRTDDRVFDPCCGTGGFLVAALHRMLGLTEDPKVQEHIRRDSLYGIEYREDMYSIATTNMILRGDGKSNLVCGDFLKQDAQTLCGKGFTVGFINPPYSQGKTEATAHLSELRFICHLLDSLAPEARCVAIVPQSTMVGKTKQDKIDKRYILDNHTLEGVITLNTNTFYGVGVNPVIAVFTAGVPHPEGKLVKFVNFQDDGYVVAKHLGLLAKDDVEGKRRHLLDCWYQGKADSSKFIVRTTVEHDDEWLHAFYYYNDELPRDEDFRQAMADYLTFEFSMIAHGRGYLFGEKAIDPPQALNRADWGWFTLGDYFDVVIGKSLDANKMEYTGSRPYITRKTTNNGLEGFIDAEEELLNIAYPVITIGNETCTPFVQTFPFFTGTKVNIMIPKFAMSRYVLQFVSMCIAQLRDRFSYSFTINSTRLKELRVQLPKSASGTPDWEYMEEYMQGEEQAIRKVTTPYYTEKKK